MSKSKVDRALGTAQLVVGLLGGIATYRFIRNMDKRTNGKTPGDIMYEKQKRRMKLKIKNFKNKVVFKFKRGTGQW